LLYVAIGKVIPAPSGGPHSLMSRKVPSQAIVSVKGCSTAPIASVFTAAAINSTPYEPLEAARTSRPRSQGREAAPDGLSVFPQGTSSWPGRPLDQRSAGKNLSTTQAIIFLRFVVFFLTGRVVSVLWEPGA
jgi:hypothetical protein